MQQILQFEAKCAALKEIQQELLFNVPQFHINDGWLWLTHQGTVRRYYHCVAGVGSWELIFTPTCVGLQMANNGISLFQGALIKCRVFNPDVTVALGKWGLAALFKSLRALEPDLNKANRAALRQFLDRAKFCN
jgi:hypothetical protein